MKENLTSKPINAAVRIGYFHLKVVDLDRALDLHALLKESPQITG